MATTVAAAYAAFGFVWIAASDTLVEALVADTHTLMVISIWKGWVFVAASAALIYAMVRGLTVRLDASEARHRLMFAESPVPMVGFDPQSLVLTDVNQAVCAQLGYPAEELIGRPLTDLYPPEERQALEHRLPEIRAGIPARGVWRAVRKDGRLIDVEVEGRSVDLGRRRMRVMALHDISQRLAAESQLLGSLDQLVAANARLREIDRAISHDLQEPLRQVTSFVQLLGMRYRGRLDADADEYISFAVQGVLLLKGLMIDAQRFAAQPVLRLEQVDLAVLVAGVLDRLRVVIDNVGADIEVGPLPVLTADADKLALVLFALLDNALKFRRPDVACRIRVTARRQPQSWDICVEDNGVGIEADYHDAIFSLFRRLQVRERIPGNGTGLALARKLVEAHGGEIAIESRPGEGSTFILSLPDGARG